MSDTPQSNGPKSDPPKAEAPRTRGWVRVLLFVSLALNILVIGVVAGGALFGEKWKRHQMAVRLESAGGPLVLALDRDERRAIERKLRRAHRQNVINPPRHREEMRGLLADIRAEPFDAQAVEARLVRLRTIFADRLAFGQTALIEHLAEMPAEDRAAYADRLEKVLRRMAK